MSYHDNAGQNHNRTFENVGRFKCLETLTNQNSIHEEIKSKLNSGDA
jgi:hypothetical protein